MILTKIYEEINDSQCNSKLKITVDYEPETGDCDILSVKVIGNGVKTDITDLLVQNIPGRLDDIISDIDWEEIYLNKRVHK